MFRQPVFLSDRRGFLGALGSLASSLAIADDAWRVRLDPLRPHAPRLPPLPAKAKSVIVLFMVGGPSSIDTFDYKPQLQQQDGKPLPTSIRDSLKGGKFADVLHGTDDKILASPFAWNQYGENGMWISDLFPHTAAMSTSCVFCIRFKPIRIIMRRPVINCIPAMCAR